MLNIHEEDVLYLYTSFRCEYLLQEKGQEFVHQIQARFPRLFEQVSRKLHKHIFLVKTLCAYYNTCFFCSLFKSSWQTETALPESLWIRLVSWDKFTTFLRKFWQRWHKSHRRVFSLLLSVVHLGPGEERSEDAVMMNTPVIKSALDMGFERNLVKQTVQSKILTSGENYRTVQELVSDLLSAEDQKREEEREMLAEAMASGTADCKNVQLMNYTVQFLSFLYWLFVSLWFRWFHLCEETPGSIDSTSEERRAGVGAFKRAKCVMYVHTFLYFNLVLTMHLYHF